MKESLREIANRIAEGRCGKGCCGCPANNWRSENGACIVRRFVKIENAEEQIEKMREWAKNNRLCAGCGRKVDNTWVWCPWCGVKVERTDKE